MYVCVCVYPRERGTIDAVPHLTHTHTRLWWWWSRFDISLSSLPPFVLIPEPPNIHMSVVVVGGGEGNIVIYIEKYNYIPREYLRMKKNNNNHYRKCWPIFYTVNVEKVEEEHVCV